MGRQLHVEYTGAIYQAMQSTDHRDVVCLDDENCIGPWRR